VFELIRRSNNIFSEYIFYYENFSNQAPTTEDNTSYKPPPGLYNRAFSWLWKLTCNLVRFCKYVTIRRSCVRCESEGYLSSERVPPKTTPTESATTNLDSVVHQVLKLRRVHLGDGGHCVHEEMTDFRVGLGLARLQRSTALVKIKGETLVQ
jgi:hypothetical protein